MPEPSRESMLAHLELRGWHPVYSTDRFPVRRGTEGMLAVKPFSTWAYAADWTPGVTLAGDWGEFPDWAIECFFRRDLEPLGAS